MASWQRVRAGLPAVFLAGALLLGPATGPAAALALATPTTTPVTTATATATSSPTATPTAAFTAIAAPSSAATAIPPSATATATTMGMTSGTPAATATVTAVPSAGTPTPGVLATPTVISPDPPPTSTASPSPAPGIETTTPTAGPLASPTSSPTVRATASPTGTATASPTGTATASPTVTATASPTVTATVSPTPSPVRISEITPASVTNTAGVSVTIMGSGFAPGQVVTIGGRPLTDVQFLSPAHVVGTLPAGLCPGHYAAAVTPPGGSPVAGGRITLHGVQSAAFAGAMPSWSITLDGADQQRQLLLAPIQIVDTTCRPGDWRVQVAITASTEHGKGHPTFLPQLLAVAASAAGPAASLDLRHAAAGVLSIPRPAGAASALVTPTMTVLVPASSYAGALTLPITVTLLAGG